MIFLRLNALVNKHLTEHRIYFHLPWRNVRARTPGQKLRWSQSPGRKRRSRSTRGRKESSAPPCPLQGGSLQGIISSSYRNSTRNMQDSRNWEKLQPNKMKLLLVQIINTLLYCFDQDQHFTFKVLSEFKLISIERILCNVGVGNKHIKRCHKIGMKTSIKHPWLANSFKIQFVVRYILGLYLHPKSFTTHREKSNKLLRLTLYRGLSSFF